jgi:hypothetical protein
MRQTGEIDMKLDLTTGAAGGAVASRAHQARLHAEDRGRSLPSRSIVVMPAKTGIQRWRALKVRWGLRGGMIRTGSPTVVLQGMRDEDVP